SPSSAFHPLPSTDPSSALHALRRRCVGGGRQGYRRQTHEKGLSENCWVRCNCAAFRSGFDCSRIFLLVVGISSSPWPAAAQRFIRSSLLGDGVSPAWSRAFTSHAGCASNAETHASCPAATATCSGARPSNSRAFTSRAGCASSAETHASCPV